KLVMEISKSIKEDFLHQNAFDDIDTFTSAKKQFFMLRNIITYYQEGFEALKQKNILTEFLMKLPIREKIGRVKYKPETELEQCDLSDEIREAIRNISQMSEVSA
ncbi:MAG: V-type ATP synthase subunit A, partial [Caldisericia bacterium]|nr:V-type ATP synthase subunit A [Caldisericia bacterium]